MIQKLMALLYQLSSEHTKMNKKTNKDVLKRILMLKIHFLMAFGQELIFNMKLLKILKNNNFNLQEIINKYYLLIIYLN